MAKVASKVLRGIIESADETIGNQLAGYRKGDDRMREAIEAVDRYLEKVRLLRVALRGGDADCISNSSPPHVSNDPEAAWRCVKDVADEPRTNETDSSLLKACLGC